MRFRGTAVATNTPPTDRSAAGGTRSGVMFRPLISKAARQLGIDEVEIARSTRR